ncbi:MAG: class I SAM-dependent methyltransferase [Bryobacteraceae bacterium]
MEKPTLDKFPHRVLAQIDIQTAFIVSRLIVAAERLQVFRALQGTPTTADVIGEALGIHRYYLRPFLTALVSLGLLRSVNGRYTNTAFASSYFVRERSIYWTRQFSAECVEQYEALCVLEDALSSGRRYEAITGRKTRPYTEEMKRNERQAEDFTQMLFHLHQGDAVALAGYLDLSSHRAVLDVCGGSGVMSIALAKRNPHLRACILDIAPVCKIAAGNVKRAGLSRRIATVVGDARQPFPEGYDVVLFCDIGPLAMRHLRNAYRSLPPAGLVVLADRYFTDDGTKPLDRLASFFTHAGFGLATRSEMVEAVKSCGFEKVRAKSVFEDVWFITGTKPTP